MPCLLGCLALTFPRVVLAVVWLVDPAFIGAAFPRLYWPVLGFLFMPLTTLAYAWTMHSGSGSITPGYLIVIIVAALIDLGMIGGASRRKYRTPPR